MLSSFSHNFISNEANLKIFVYSQLAIVRVSFPKILKLGSLEGKFDFSVSRDLKFKAILITKSQKIKLYSVRDSKHCLNDNNLRPGRVTETIPKFGA